MAKKLKALAEEAGSRTSSPENQGFRQSDLARRSGRVRQGAGRGRQNVRIAGAGRRGDAEQGPQDRRGRPFPKSSRRPPAWDKLEQVFEDRVARALHSLSVPTRKDVDSLARRVAELTKGGREAHRFARRAGQKGRRGGRRSPDAMSAGCSRRPCGKGKPKGPE